MNTYIKIVSYIFLYLYICIYIYILTIVMYVLLYIIYKHTICFLAFILSSLCVIKLFLQWKWSYNIYYCIDFVHSYEHV